MLEIVAYGRPAPQGSKRHVGKGVMVESSKAVKPWRDDVKAAAEKAIAGLRGTVCPFDAPLVVRMVFTMPKPTSAPKRRRTWPQRTPDLSKLIRSTEDALTAAGVWADDARVVDYERAAKVYPGEDPEALDAPGVRITIRPTTSTTLRRTAPMTADDPAIELVATATEHHYIVAERTDAMGNNPCVCDQWWDAAGDSPSWDEHMAEVALAALRDAGLIADVGTEENRTDA